MADLNARVTAIVLFITSLVAAVSAQTVVTNPTSSQNIVQPVGTQLSSNNVANIRYVTAAFNWSISPGGTMTGGVPYTLTFVTCPLGVSGSDGNLFVYVSGGTGASEVIPVSGGTCTPGLSGGTLQFTPANTHSSSFAVGSASTGVYEALADATSSNPNDAHLVLSPVNPPPTAPAYACYAPITITGSNIEIDGGNGALIDLESSRACFVLTSTAIAVHVHGFRVGTKSGTYAAANTSAAITQTACSSNVSTITTTLNPPVGSVVDVQGTFNQHYLGPHTVSTTSATTWTYTDTNCGGSGTIPSQSTAGGNAYQFAFVETNGQGTHVDDISVNYPGTWSASGPNNLFVVLNDQAFHANDIQLDSGIGGCNSNYCSNGIYAPGPFSTNAAVIWGDHLGFSVFCTGNGITAWNGNTVHISDSIVQGFEQWGIYVGTLRGGYGGSTFTNVYEEVGSCSNPQYPGSGAQQQAEAGLIVNGGGNFGTTIRGGEFPIGQLPEFAATGNQGTRYNYCFVVHDSTSGISKCLSAGYALVDSSTPSGNIVVSWPRIQGTGTVTYDLVRFPGAGLNEVWPYNGNCTGGATSACGSVSTAITQCATTLCSFTDSASASTANYSVPSPSEAPGMRFLPGGLVALASSDYTNWTPGNTYVDSLSFVTPTSPVVTEFPTEPQIFAHNCLGANGGEWLSCLGSPSQGNDSMPAATVLQYGVSNGGPTANLKGRINMTGSPTVPAMNSGEIVTLVDSNPAKTLATPGNRPSQDAADTYLGSDSGSVGYTSVGLAVGAPISISQYIDSTPDGASYLERLTSTQKTLTVPLNLPSLEISLIATSSLTAGTPVKLDTSNANQVVSTTTADTGAGIVVGVVGNAPSGGGRAFVITSGTVGMTLGTGTCSIGNWVIVDTTTNGRVKCAATYPTAGTIIGKAQAADSSVGTKFNVFVGLR